MKPQMDRQIEVYSLPEFIEINKRIELLAHALVPLISYTIRFCVAELSRLRDSIAGKEIELLRAGVFRFAFEMRVILQNV